MSRCLSEFAPVLSVTERSRGRLPDRPPMNRPRRRSPSPRGLHGPRRSPPRRSPPRRRASPRRRCRVLGISGQAKRSLGAGRPTSAVPRSAALAPGPPIVVRGVAGPSQGAGPPPIPEAGPHPTPPRGPPEALAEVLRRREPPPREMTPGVTADRSARRQNYCGHPSEVRDTEAPSARCNIINCLKSNYSE